MSPNRTRLYAMTIIILFSFIIVTGIGNFRSKQLAVNLTGGFVTQAVGLAVEALDEEKLLKLVKTMDEKDPYYADIRKSLTDIKNEHKLNNISIFYKDEERFQWFHIADTKEPGDPDHKALGKPEKSVSGAIEKTIRGKTVQGEYSITSQGPVVSSYQEIKDSQGKTFAVLEGNFQAGEMTDFLFVTRYAQFGLLALTLLLLGGAFLLTRKGK